MTAYNLFLSITLICLVGSAPVHAKGTVSTKSKLKPVVSGSLASDEILLALSNEQEAKTLVLSPLVDDPAYSSVVASAAGIPGRWHNSAESLVALDPGLVILASFNHPSLKARLNQAKIPFVELKGFNHLDDLKTNITIIGKAIDRQKEAKELVAMFDQTIKDMANINKLMKNMPSLLSYSPAAMPGGKNTLIDDIIRKAGGKNLASEMKINGWAKVNEEILIAMQPDYIIMGEGDKSRPDLIKQISNDPLWKHMRAVKEQKFIFVNQTQLLSVSHHVLKAVEAIHQVLAADIEHWNISLGKNSRIRRDTTEEQLIAMFGAKNVQPTDVSLGEGETEPGTVIFPNSKTKTMFIIWKDAKIHDKIHSLSIFGGKSEWKFPHEITLGTSLKELEKLNGKPFTLTGFEWDYSGTVLDWNNGSLAKTLEDAPARILLRLDRRSAPTAKMGLIGEKDFLSSNNGMQKLNPTAYEIIVEFN